jgi:hypothetical protein
MIRGGKSTTKKVFAWILVLTLALGMAALANASTTMTLGHFGKLPDTGDPLGNAEEMIEQTQQGLIEACLVSEGTFDKCDIRYAFVTAPNMFYGYDQAYAVVDGLFAE